MPKLGWTQIFSSIAWKMTKFYSSKVQYCHSSKSGSFQPTKFYYYASERCVGLHVGFRKNFIKQNLHHFSQLKFGIYNTISYLAPSFELDDFHCRDTPIIKRSTCQSKWTKTSSRTLWVICIPPGILFSRDLLDCKFMCLKVHWKRCHKGTPKIPICVSSKI